MKAWKWCVGLFFLLVIGDGALRKWVLPSQSAALFVLKDAVLWAGFGLYALRRSPLELPRPLRRTGVPLLLGGYVFLVLLQAFNPRLPNLVISGLGMKAHLAFLPLVVLMPAIIAETTEEKIIRLLWGYTLCLVLPLAVLSVYQFFQPPTAWINQYVREMGTIATVEGHARVISTFSYVGSHTAYLTVNAFLSVGILLAGLRTDRWDLKTLGGLIFGATFVVLPMAGSRGPVVIILVSLATLLFVAESSYRWSLRLVATICIVAVVVIQGFGGFGLAEGWQALAERAEQAGDTEGRIENVMTGPIVGLERGGLFGYGAGSTHQAASRFVPGSFSNDWLPEGYVETRVARIVIELGALGWLLLLAMKTTLLYLAYQTVRRSRQVVDLIVGVTAFCLLLAHLPFPIIYNAVSGAFYWGAAGAMLGVWSLQEVRREILAAEPRGTAPEVPA
jgi:hypothetical protein